MLDGRGDSARMPGELGTIVAVIPAYNEERFIASVVLTALQQTPHVIVVDDGSTDRTADLARMAGADVVVMPENGGKGRALNAGFERARSYRPDAVVMLDGDAQHDPDEIRAVAGPILQGEADIVIGSRFLQTKSEIPGWRQVGQHVLTRVTNGSSGLALTDSQSGFRAFSPEAMTMLHFRSAGLAVESEMQFLLEGSPFQETEVPISVSYRDGNKRNPVVHGIEVLEAIFSLVASRRPLMFLSVPGAVLVTLGVLVGIFVVHIVQTRHGVPVGTAVLSSLLIIIGLMLGLIGVVLQALQQFIGSVREELHAALARVPAS